MSDKPKMTIEFYLQGIPATLYPYEDCDAKQLELLSKSVQDILAKIEEASKGASIVSALSTRLSIHQSVRCTKQSVNVTAAARYTPSGDDLDLSFLTIMPFVDLVVYLPLPDIKSFSRNASAIKRAAQIWQGSSLDPRWTIYYECLKSVNNSWAALFLDEIQSHIHSINKHSLRASDPSSTRLDAASPSTELQRRLSTATASRSLPPDPSGSSGSSTRDAKVAQGQVFIEESMSLQDGNVVDETKTLPPIEDENIFLRVIRAKSASWGIEHPTTLDSMVHLASLYISQARFVDARDLLVKCLCGLEKSHPRDSPEVSQTSRLLAEVEYRLNDAQTHR